MPKPILYHLAPPSQRMHAAMLRCLSRVLYTPEAPAPICHHQYELSRVGLRCVACKQGYYDVLFQLSHREAQA